MSFYVVDGHSHLFRAYHAVGYLSTSKGVPSHAVLILSTMLWKLIREEKPDYLGIALDPPGPTFRDALFTEYKATRTAMPDDLARQLPYVQYVPLNRKINALFPFVDPAIEAVLLDLQPLETAMRDACRRIDQVLKRP